MTSLLLDPKSSAQALILVCSLSQLLQSGLSLPQFINVAAELPFKTTNPDNKLHEGKDPDNDKFTAVSLLTHEPAPGTQHPKQAFHEYCWMSEWTN